MKGLFYCDDADGITFLRFNPDGSVILYGKSVKLDRFLPSVPGPRVDSEKVNFGQGKYYVDSDGRIRIIVEGTLGKVDYRGTIQNEDRIDFRYRCPITNHRNVETFQRFSENEHIHRFKVNKRNDN